MLVCSTQSVNRLPLPPSCPPSQGYLRAAKCHLMLGNPSLSIDFYQKVLHVQPHHKQAKEEVGGLHLGVLTTTAKLLRVVKESFNWIKHQDFFLFSPSPL